MAVLYLVEPGSTLRKRGERFIVEKEGKEILEVEARRLDTVLMLSSVQVTTPALCEMLGFGVEFAVMSRNGKLLGQLTPPTPRNVLLRKAQFYKETDTRFALTQSREIVRAKIDNARQALIRASWKDRDTPAPILSAIDRLKTLEARVDHVQSIESLMGVEGAAAASYWKAFGCLFTARDVSFPGRVKHPATDPVNAVLSFGYVLLTNLLQSLLDGMGFDPFLGFYHEEHYGRPSLALDLVEPFRAPVLDRFAVRVFNLGILKPRHFKEERDQGLRMRSDAMRAFFRHWERHLDKMGIHAAVRAQAEQLARVFRGESPVVEPWRWSARG